jgi:hypothetical protein
LNERANGSLDIFWPGSPVTNADSDDGPASPGRAAAPALPGSLNIPKSRRSQLILFARHEYLIEHDVVVDLETVFGKQPGEESRVLAKLFHQFLNSFTPEGFQDRP